MLHIFLVCFVLSTLSLTYAVWFLTPTIFLQDKERIAVYIRGAQCINRAVDGDIVAFELLPEAEWYSQDGMPGGSAKEEVRDIAKYFFQRGFY